MSIHLYWSFSNLWQNGMVDSLQSLVLAKFTWNNSLFLTKCSLVEGLKGNNLLFLGRFNYWCFSLLSDSVRSPRISFKYNHKFKFVLYPDLNVFFTLQKSILIYHMGKVSSFKTLDFGAFKNAGHIDSEVIAFNLYAGKKGG